MTTSTITVVHCDFPGCDQQAPQPESRTMPEGWADALHTHGCPQHAGAISDHRASVDCDTYRRKDWWSLKCACGWTPRPATAAWSSSGLREKHLAHVAEVLATVQAIARELGVEVTDRG